MLAGFLSACSAGPAVLNALTSRSGYSETTLRYAPGERGTMDLYVPDGASDRTPVVVFFYGGSWDSGSKAIYRFVGQALAAEGFAVAVPDYRVYPDVVFPGFVEDGARAVAAVQRLAREGGSPLPAGRHPLALMGHSAGAQIAALLALDPRYLRAAGSDPARISALVGLSGPYDFLPLDEERYKRIFPVEVRDQSQPVRYARAGAPPTFLAAGLADTTVDPENTRSLARALRAKGVAVEETLIPDIDHIGTISSFATALPLGDRDLAGAVATFLRRHLA